MSKSPAKLKKAPKLEDMTFPEAVKEVIAGCRISKREWNDPGKYGFVNGEVLSIHLNGINHKWMVSLGDMSGDDWYVV